MRSIDNATEADAVREFDGRVRKGLDAEGFDSDAVEYVCEPKFDGLSVEVIYEDGEYVRAATRGDGTAGDDVTEQVRTIRSVPGKLRGDPPSRLAVRGEAYMPRDAFKAYNEALMERGEEPFANPRNAAAGTLRQLDPSVVAERPLDIFFFDVLGWENDAEGDSPTVPPPTGKSSTRSTRSDFDAPTGSSASTTSRARSTTATDSWPTART